MLLTLARAALLAGALLAGGAHAAATSDVPDDKLSPVRAMIQQRQWNAAIEELKKLNDAGSADWNNLMGYVLRKSRTPDLEAAGRFYEAALKIDPKHRGALEYSGELFLMLGDLARAEERLKALDKLCLLPCDEYSMLKKEVERFKANGNKHVPQG